MPKMKVQDLAKELGRSSKEVINAASSMREEKLTVLSTLTDAEIAHVKSVLPAVEKEKEVKKHPAFVFRPQNSSSGQSLRQPKKASSNNGAKKAAPAAARPAQKTETAPKTEAAAAAKSAAPAEAAKPEIRKPVTQAEAAIRKPSDIAAETAAETVKIIKEAPAKEAPVKEAAAKEAPVKEAPAKEAPAKESEKKAESAPVKEAPAKETPAKEAPAKETPKKETPREEKKETAAPAKETPAKAEKAEAKPEKPEEKGPRKVTAAEAIVRSSSTPVVPQIKIIERPQPVIVKPAQPAQPAQGDGRRSGGRRDGQGGYQNRDGQRRDGQGGGYQNRDGQRRDGQGGYQNRDGQRRDGQGGYQNRDGQRRDGQGGGYQNRDGQGGYQRRDGQGGGYQNRDGQSGYQRRDGQGGGFQNRDGQRRDGQGGFQNRDGQNRGQGGFQGRGQGAGGRDGQRPAGRGPAGGFQGRGGAKPGADLTPVNAKNNDRSKNFSKKTWEKDHKDYEDPKRQENTRNLSKGRKAVPAPAAVEETKEEEIRTLTLPDTITIKDLADMMKQPGAAIVKKLFLAGEMVTLNTEIDYDKAEEIAMDFNCICEHEVKVDVLAELLKDVEDDPADMVPRPPVVCVMGHVDHGKTSLLDAIRNTHVTDREAGGITQHIGAYTVTCQGKPITFLDTPGHEAFTAMRLRGAKSTDIAVLVVAADDGVMPQTEEAISHARAAEVDIIVAINKIDKVGANVDHVKQELAERGLVPEDWGGSTICVPVSARTGEGIDDLLEMILLDADVKELRSNPNRRARGIVIEAQLDRGRGPVATVLVQKGKLHVGDFVAVGPCYGKVRAMIDDKGRRIKEAGPSTPVEILGLNDVPTGGDTFVSPETEKDARAFAETFVAEGRQKMLEETKAKLTVESLFTQIKEGSVKELNIIVKADVQGSVEAVKQSLTKLSTDEVVVKIIHSAVGAINESDVSLAQASNAIIVGFNTKPDPTAKSIAEREKVDVRLYTVIYKAIEDIDNVMKGKLDPIYEEKVIGHAVVRALFKASGVGTIAGSYVMDGIMQRGCSVRITHEGTQVFDGPLASLKRFKDDVKEVKEGYECGLVFEKFNDVQVDDMIEAYAMVEVPRQ